MIYEKLTVAWDLPFDKMITVLEGDLRIHSDGLIHDLQADDIGLVPAHTPLTYEVAGRVTRNDINAALLGQSYLWFRPKCTAFGLCARSW